MDCTRKSDTQEARRILQGRYESGSEDLEIEKEGGWQYDTGGEGHKKKSPAVEPPKSKTGGKKSVSFDSAPQYKLGGRPVPPTKASKYGGAIQDPTLVPVRPPAGLKDIMYEDDMGDRLAEEEEGDELFDEEAGAYSHYGGSLSGRGLAHDDSATARAMMKTFANHPEVLHTYVQGRVPNPQQMVPHLTQRVHSRSQGSGASIIDYGGSLHGISHSENGFLMSHDPSFSHEFYIRS